MMNASKVRYSRQEALGIMFSSVLLGLAIGLAVADFGLWPMTCQVLR